jgi:hypothetical protein
MRCMKTHKWVCMRTGINSLQKHGCIRRPMVSSDCHVRRPPILRREGLGSANSPPPPWSNPFTHPTCACHEPQTSQSVGFGRIMTLELEDELLQAVKQNDTTAVAALLAAGADPNSGLFRDETALSIAVHNGSGEILDLLLRRGSLCCMVEQHGDAQKRPATRSSLLHPIVSTLKNAIMIPLATYGLHKLALSLPPNSLQTLALFISHYMWFIDRRSLLVLYSNATIRSRYPNPFDHLYTVISASINHRIYVFFIQKVLPAPTVTMPSLGYVQEIAVG